MFPNAQDIPANLRAQDAALEAELWEAGARKYEDTMDIWTAMEGGQDAVIETVTRTSAGQGHKITFRQESGFHGEGLVEDEDFEDDDDYEEHLMSSDSLRVGLLRNGTQSWFLTAHELGMGQELESGLNTKLGEWLGREKGWQMSMALIHKIRQENHWSVDALGIDSLRDATAMLRPLGGSPARIHKDPNGNDIWGMVFVTTTEGVAVLKADPEYADLVKSAHVQSGSNPLFTGDTVMLDGNVIKHWDVKDHDGEGPVGSPLNPKAYLGVAIAAGTGALEIKGGGAGATVADKTKNKFFRYFPAYNFRFVGGGSVAVDAVSHGLHLNGSDKRFYVTIVNPKNATVDAGKWAIYECSTNDGNKITVTKRLGASIGGIAHTTVGGVTWSGTVNSADHPQGSLVYWSDEAGVPLGRTIGLGKGAARRGYGMFRSKRFMQPVQGGMKKELYIASIFGQAPRVDRMKRNPAVLVLTHPIKYPGWNHPTP